MHKVRCKYSPDYIEFRSPCVLIWSRFERLASQFFVTLGLIPVVLIIFSCSSKRDSGKETTGAGADASGNGGGGTADGASGNVGASGSSAGTKTFGDAHSGNMWLGPVDFAETKFHNACAPTGGYPSGIRVLYGSYLMGLSDQVVLQSLAASGGKLCDACAELKANGKTVVAHAVTYGQETGPNDIDLSPEARDALGISDSNYTGSWQFVTCPSTDPIRYTFDGRQWTNTWFFRVWARNARVPLFKLEYRLGSGAWTAMDQQSDGAWQASGQDFSKGFSLKATSLDSQTIEDTIAGIGTFDASNGITSHGNFD